MLWCGKNVSRNIYFFANTKDMGISATVKSLPSTERRNHHVHRVFYHISHQLAKPLQGQLPRKGTRIHLARRTARPHNGAKPLFRPAAPRKAAARIFPAAEKTAHPAAMPIMPSPPSKKVLRLIRFTRCCLIGCSCRITGDHAAFTALALTCSMALLTPAQRFLSEKISTMPPRSVNGGPCNTDKSFIMPFWTIYSTIWLTK